MEARSYNQEEQLGCRLGALEDGQGQLPPPLPMHPCPPWAQLRFGGLVGEFGGPGPHYEAQQRLLVTVVAGPTLLCGPCERAVPFQAGKGAQMKLVVNMIMGSMMASFAEGIVLAEEIGLEKEDLLEVIGLGAINSPMYNLKVCLNGSGSRASGSVHSIFSQHTRQAGVSEHKLVFLCALLCSHCSAYNTVP